MLAPMVENKFTVPPPTINAVLPAAGAPVTGNTLVALKVSVEPVSAPSDPSPVKSSEPVIVLVPPPTACKAPPLFMP